MAIVGSVVINASMQTADVVSGAKRVRDEVANTNSAISSLAAGVAIGNLATTAFTKLVDSLKSAALHSFEMASHVRQLAADLQTLPEKAANTEFVAQRSRVGFEAVATSVKAMQLSMGKALAGNKEEIAAWQTLKLDPKKLASREPIEVWDEVIDRIAQLPNAYERAAAAQEVFGKAGRNLAPLINRGPGAVAALRARDPASPDNEAVPALNRISAGWSDTKAELETGVMNTIGRTAATWFHIQDKIRSAFGLKSLAPPVDAAQNAAFDEKAAAQAERLAEAKKKAAEAAKELARAQQQAQAAGEKLFETWGQQIRALRNDFSARRQQVEAWLDSSDARKLNPEDRLAEYNRIKKMAERADAEDAKAADKKRIATDADALRGKFEDPYKTAARENQKARDAFGAGLISKDVYDRAKAENDRRAVEETKKRADEAIPKEDRDLRAKLDQLRADLKTPAQKYEETLATIAAGLAKGDVTATDAAALESAARKNLTAAGDAQTRDRPAATAGGGWGTEQAYRTMLEATKRTPAEDAAQKQIQLSQEAGQLLLKIKEASEKTATALEDTTTTEEV